jgi:hypothetical protein
LPLAELREYWAIYVEKGTEKIVDRVTIGG